MKINFDLLTRNGFEVLAQLFLCGPTWDGDIVSKRGRDELVKLGIAERNGYGYSYLTPDGVNNAIEWDAATLKKNYQYAWLAKRRRSGHV